MAKSKKNIEPVILENGALEVYSYSEKTGEYVGTDMADPDPMRPGHFLIPARATNVAPPEPKNGKVRTWNGEAWEYTDAPQPTEQQVERNTPESKAAAARYVRNTLLLQSDWRMLPDVPQKHSTGWAAYRQALRDVPQQEGFPETINWPQQPE